MDHIKTSYKLKDEIFYLIDDALDINDYAKAKILIGKLHYADIADLIDNSNFDDRKKIFEILGNDFDPEIIVELNTEVKNSIIDIIGTKNFALILGKLDVDKVIHIIEVLSNDKRDEIINHLDESEQKSLLQHLSYPENSAGRIMNKSIVAILENYTIDQTIKYIRELKNLPKDFYELFIVDNNHKIIGSVLISNIIKSEANVKLSEIANKDLIMINTGIDQEEVSYLFKQYSLISAPVIDDNNKLVGIITIDDIIDVMEEETEEDIRKMVGVGEKDFYSSSMSVVKQRLPWLIINLLTAFMTSKVIDFFHDSIEQLVALASIMPIVASMGGNAGSQALTVAVRAIANRSLNITNATKVIFKEMFTNAVNGIILAIIGGFIVAIWQMNIYLSIVFATAVIINFIIAGFLGATIPIILTRLGADPAVSSSVFLTALTDLSGFLLFLGFASMFLI